MKALTLIQPWASLIVDGRKDIETRSWPTSFRGIFAVHAGARVDKEACQDFGYDPKAIPTRAVLGTAELREDVVFPSVAAPPDEYGDFSPGRHGFILANARKFKTPIPAKGMLGFWEWERPEAEVEF